MLRSQKETVKRHREGGRVTIRGHPDRAGQPGGRPPGDRTVKARLARNVPPGTRPTSPRADGPTVPGRGEAISATRTCNGLRQGSILRFGRWQYMDRQTKREIWVLAIGMVIVETPIVAIAALAIAAAH
jgi:hypothetical protein